MHMEPHGPFWSYVHGQFGFTANCRCADALCSQDSSGPNCSGHVDCSQDIIQQPYNPFALNSRYAERAFEIFERFKPGSGADAGKPFFLYVAFGEVPRFPLLLPLPPLPSFHCHCQVATATSTAAASLSRPAVSMSHSM